MAKLVIRNWREGNQALHIILDAIKAKHIEKSRIRMVISNSSSSAYARIWGLQKIFQVAYKMPAAYVIEVIWPRFFKMKCRDKISVLLHELAHIPENFSGGLRPHTKKFYDTYNLFVERLEKKLRADPDLRDRLCLLLEEGSDL
ncbi:MAG: putative metallopeptidase [Pyrodictiaceae archaeon]